MNNNLDIFLITYNRAPFLRETLAKITTPASPLRNYHITILDNNSSDQTAEICKEFVQSNPNLSYIKNNRNIGLSGNICKAMEMARKEYYWILCDNDKIDFSAWPDIERAMQEGYDLIMSSVDYNCDKVKDKRSFALAQSTFLPGCIYKTKYLTDDIMTYAIADTYTVLPHVCVACNIVNNNGRIFIPSSSVITLTANVKISDTKNYTYDRVQSANPNKLVHERTLACHFGTGIAGSFKALKDKKLRKETIRNFIYSSRLNGYGPYFDLSSLWWQQCGYGKTYPMKPYIWKELMYYFPMKEKIKIMLFALIPVTFYYQKDWFFIKIGPKFKTKLFKNVRGNAFFDFLTSLSH